MILSFFFVFFCFLEAFCSDSKTFLDKKSKYQRILQTGGSELSIIPPNIGTEPNVQAMDYANGFVIVWHALQSSGSTIFVVWVQLLNIDGSLNGSPFQVDTTTTTNQCFPQITGLFSGGFIIVWSGIHPTSGKTVNFGQIYSSTATTAGDRFDVDVDGIFTDSDQDIPQIGNLYKDGGFVVTWGIQSAVYCQIFWENGTSKGNAIHVFDGIDGYSPDPQINGIRTGDFIIIAAFGDDLLGKLYSSDGDVHQMDFGINTMSPVTGHYLSSTTNGFLVAYCGQNINTYNWDIYGQFFDYSANPIGNEVTLDSAVTGNDSNPFIVVLDDESIILAYDFWTSVTKNDVFFSKYDPDGVLLVDSQIVNTATSGDQYYNSIAVLSNGNFVIVWDDFQSSGSIYSIKGKIWTPGVQPFKFITNRLMIKQGNSVVIDDSMINTLGPGVITYTAEYVMNGFFSYSTDINTSIFSFTQTDIDAEKLYFTHDGSIYPPSYYLRSTNGASTSSFTMVSVTFQTMPSFVMNNISIEQNTKIVITDSQIDGTVSQDQIPMFLVISSADCQFENKSKPGVAISNFTTIDISNLWIYFIAYDTVTTPSYVLGLMDGDGEIVTSPGDITYFITLKMLTNQMTITQGELLLIYTSILNCQVDPQLEATYLIENTRYGSFVLISDLQNSVVSFTNTQVSNDEVYFQHDGSLHPPDILISINDGFFTTETYDFIINFIPNYLIVTNQLNINTGQSVNITDNFLYGISNLLDADNSTIIFTISDLLHSIFIVNDQSDITFSMQDIIDQQVILIHDKSQYPPSYRVSIGDGIIQSDPKSALISFNGQKPYPILIYNSLVVSQGETIELSNQDLLGYDGGNNNDFMFSVINVTNAFFAFKSNLNQVITQFSLTNINGSQVVLIHDDSRIAPKYLVQISTISGFTNGIYIPSVIDFNSQPLLLTNFLQIQKGEKIFINSNYLSGDDDNIDPGNLIFFMNDVEFGQFENVNVPSVPVFMFYQSEIDANEILFLHDGTNNAPSYYVSLSNGAITNDPVAAIIDFSFSAGMCGLTKVTTIETQLLKSIGITKTTDYVIASIYHGEIITININNPENPFIVKNSSLDLSVYQVTKLSELIIYDDLVFVLSETQTLAIVSISNPKTPKFIAAVGGVRSCVDFTVCNNNYVYMACLSAGIHVISLQTILTPTFVGTITFGSSSIASVDCFDDFLFAVTQDTPGKFFVLDLQNPTSPPILSTITLTASSNYVKIDSKKITAFVATDSGVDIVNITNVLNPAYVSSVKTSMEALSLDISDDEVYLSVITDQVLIIVNVLNLNAPITLDTLSYDYGLQQPFFLPFSHYGFLASTEGFLVFNIFKGVKSRVAPQIASIISSNPNALYKNIAVSPDGIYSYMNVMDDGEQTLLIMDDSNKTLKAVALGCTTFESPCLAPTKDGSSVFVTTCGNVSVVDVVPIKAAGVRDTFKIDSAWGVAVSADSKYVYVTNNKMKLVHILTDDPEAGFNQISTVNLSSYSSIPKMLTSNYNDKYLYVILEGQGIVIIDITNKNTPILLTIPKSITNLGDARSLVYKCDIYGNEYIIVTLKYEGLINVVNVKDPLNAYIVASQFIGKQTTGIGLFLNKNYLATQSVHSMTILEIRNMSNPIIIDIIDSATILDTYQIGVLNDVIILPTFEVYSLYYGETFFYPHLESHTNNLGVKVFYITFFEVNPITLDETQQIVNLLSVETQDSWPYWMTMDYTVNVLTVAPPAMQSLVALNKLKLTFGTQIPTSDISTISTDTQEVINELLNENYIDANSIPTIQYDPEKTILLSTNSTLNTTLVANVLDKHLFKHYIVFNLDDFLILDNAPDQGSYSLQDQFGDEPIPKVGRRIDFQMDDTTFIDVDGDTLNYQVFGLPQFLQFSPYNIKFYGTPTRDDLGVYSIEVVATDGYKNNSQNFTVSVTNLPPTVISSDDQYFHLGQTIDFTLPSNTFVDPDGDQMTYAAKLINSTRGEVNLPDWLNLDETRLRIYGSPTIYDIDQDLINKRFYQVFTIKMMATDICDQVGSYEFNLTVSNYFPLVNPDNNLDYQFQKKYGSYIKIGEKIDFEFSAHTFLDQEDQLQYSIISEMPHFLYFSKDYFYGTTTKSDLGNYIIIVSATDGFSSVTNSFMISVQNHAPIAYEIEDYVLVFGSILNYPILPLIPFIDPDNDTLTYKAFWIQSYIMNTSNMSNSSHISNISNATNMTNLTNSNIFNITLGLLPTWLNFDILEATFSGAPNETYIPQKSDGSFYMAYNICVMAFDAGDLTNTSNFTLIVRNSVPQINPQKTLSNQFSKIDPQVLMVSEISFDDDTFIDENNETLIYSARLVSDQSKWFGRRLNQQIKINDSSDVLPPWIKFDPQVRKFTISPTQNEFNHEFTIKVYATNALLTGSDTFSFKVDMSATYAFNIFLALIGAVGSFLGIFAYRKTFYSILGKKFYCYSEYDHAYVGKNYTKTIFLIKDDVDICKFIWKELIKMKIDIISIYNSEKRDVMLCEKITEITNKLINENKIEEYFDIDNYRILEIFQSFLVLELIEKYPIANKIFTLMKKDLTAQKLKIWYQDLVSISIPILRDKDKPFPKVDINIDNFNFTLNMILIKYPKKIPYKEITENEKLLVQGKIKAYVLGIPSPCKKFDTFLEFSRGESMLVNWNQIAEIQFEKVKSNAKHLHASIFDFPQMQNFNSLPSWIHYRIEKDVIIFTGEPPLVDIGKLVIRMFNGDGVIIREFGLIVMEPEDLYVKSKRETFVNSQDFTDTALRSSFASPMLISYIKGKKEENEPMIKSSHFPKIYKTTQVRDGDEPVHSKSKMLDVIVDMNVNEEENANMMGKSPVNNINNGSIEELYLEEKKENLENNSSNNNDYKVDNSRVPVVPLSKTEIIVIQQSQENNFEL